MSSELRCWYAAVDWASEKHDIVVTDCEGKRLGRLQVEHSGGERLARMSDWLIATTGGTPDEIHIAIEVPHGPGLGYEPDMEVMEKYRVPPN